MKSEDEADGANKLAQLEENLGAANLKLRPQDLASLDEFSAPTPTYPTYFNARVVDDRCKALAL